MWQKTDTHRQFALLVGWTLTGALIGLALAWDRSDPPRQPTVKEEDCDSSI